MKRTTLTFRQAEAEVKDTGSSAPAMAFVKATVNVIGAKGVWCEAAAKAATREGREHCVAAIGAGKT